MPSRAGRLNDCVVLTGVLELNPLRIKVPLRNLTTATTTTTTFINIVKKSVWGEI